MSDEDDQDTNDDVENEVTFINDKKEWLAFYCARMLHKNPSCFPCFVKIEHNSGMGYCESSDSYFVAYLPKNIESMSPLEAFKAGTNLKWKFIGSI